MAQGNTASTRSINIWWVDDDPEKREIKVGRAMEIVTHTAKALGMQPISFNFGKFKDSGAVIEAYSGNEPRPDLVCCDYNLVNGEKGTSVIDGLRGRGYMSRMILYAVALNESDKASIKSRFRGVEVCKEDSELWERFTPAAYTLLLRVFDPEYIRGVVISSISAIEDSIEDYLVAYFSISEGKSSTFRNLVLRSEMLSLHWKIEIFSHAIGDKDTFLPKDGLERLRQLKNMRNDMAHGSVEIGGDKLIVSNRNNFNQTGTKTFSRDQVRDALNDAEILKEKITKRAQEIASSGNA